MENVKATKTGSKSIAEEEKPTPLNLAEVLKKMKVRDSIREFFQ